jgi:hypothetical protein
MEERLKEVGPVEQIAGVEMTVSRLSRDELKASVREQAKSAFFFACFHTSCTDLSAR